MKKKQIAITIAALAITSTASAGGLLGKLLGRPELLHELQIEQATDYELFDQARICKALGGTPTETKAKPQGDGGAARGLECVGQANYTVRLEIAPLPNKEASLAIEVTSKESVDPNAYYQLLSQRRVAAGINDDPCEDALEPASLDFKCAGPAVGGMVAKFRPNRFAPWTDQAKAMKEARAQAFGKD